MRYRDKAIVLFLVMAGLFLVFFRIHTLGPSLESLLPERHYEFMVSMNLNGHGEDVSVQMTIPVESDQQTVKEGMVKSSDFDFHIKNADSNRYGIWNGSGISGQKNLIYSCTVRTVSMRYELSDNLPLLKSYPASVQSQLMATDTIQSDSDEVRGLFETLVPEKERTNVSAIVRRAFDYCHTSIKPVNFSGTTDAVTCLRLGESSCGGKSRLLAALLRHGGIPARLVGGLILKEDTWTASHLWVEAWIDGAWVPFCPLNGYFAEKPLKYLVLYYGEYSLFSHTRDINFTYFFHSKQILTPPPHAVALSGILNLWNIFDQVRIPLDLLKIILLFPLGALIVVFARNIIGILTFGVFTPALLAVAFRDTGLYWGVSLFLMVLILGIFIRGFLNYFQLLHTPRLGILLTTTAICMLSISMFFVAKGYILPTRIGLFPLVIMAMTIERFSVTTEEEGLVHALKISLWTVLVACLAYWAMNWTVVERIVLAFPETLLLVIAMLFIIGRWSGLRLTEYVRFQDLIISVRRS